MLSRVMLLFFTCYLSSSTTSMIIYNNAQFVPINATFEFTVLYSISSLNECACQCFISSTCFTGTYFSINQSCSLFSIPLRREWLQVVATIMNASVFSITNRSLIGKCEFVFCYLFSFLNSFRIYQRNDNRNHDHHHSSFNIGIVYQ
jgi:hypothetical protein